MKKFKLLLTIPIMASMLLVGCKKEDITDDSPLIEPGTNEMTTGTLNLGNNVVADFHGQITDENGQPVEDATITVGNKTAMTDANGTFFVDDATVKEDLAYIKCEKSGYFLGSRSLIPSTTTTNSVRIEMLTLQIAGTVSSGQESTVTVDGASVVLKGHYVDASGNPYEGQVSVAMKYMSPTAQSTMRQMPGMLYAQDEDGSSGALETYGMVAVELYGSAGQPLNIAKGSDATLQIPLDPAQAANAPLTIPLWHFDETAGYWVREGAATLINGMYVGSVDHFSFWNCDDFFLDCQFHGVVQDYQGNPVPNAEVHITTTNASTVGTAGADGTFSTYLPANELVTMEVFDQCGNLIFYGDYSPCTNGQVNQEVLTIQGTVNQLHVTGTAQDCQLNPIANGQAEIVVNGNSFFFPVVNGVIDATIYDCQSTSSIDITVLDYGTLQQDSQTGVAVSGGVANVGTMTTCTGVSEWIDITVDGNQEVWFAPIDFNYTDSLGATGFVINANQTEWVYLESSTITPGTYNFEIDIQAVDGFTFWGSAFPQVAFITTPAVNITFTTWPAVGGYIEITASGTYYDQSSTPHTIDIDIKAQRDS